MAAALLHLNAKTLFTSSKVKEDRIANVSISQTPFRPSAIFMKLVVILLLIPFCSYTQVIFRGNVIDKNTKTVIPYATIGLVKENVGTNADDNGQFKIRSNQPGHDSIIVSCIGYVTRRLPVIDLLHDSTIFLSVDEKRLKPVVIKSQWIKSEVGRYEKYQDYCYTSSGYQSQVAKKITAPVGNTQLQSVLVRTSKYYRENALFRIHVYGFDSVTKGPGQELTDTLIEVSSKPGAITIDMLPFQILLPEKEFFISVEWLRIPFNVHHASTKFEGKDTVIVTYNPCICFTRDVIAEPEEIWHLAYSGNWHPRLRIEGTLSLAISAVVRY